MVSYYLLNLVNDIKNEGSSVMFQLMGFVGDSLVYIKFDFLFLLHVAKIVNTA